jgi:hypothetical protein
VEGLTSEDSCVIGFVVACYFKNAISTEELHAWAEHVLRVSNEYPPYILDLMEFNEAKFHVFRTIGFNPESCLSSNQELALCGITYLRDRSLYEGPPLDEALTKLRRCPEVAERFRSIFPFLSFGNAR